MIPKTIPKYRTKNRKPAGANTKTAFHLLQSLPSCFVSDSHLGVGLATQTSIAAVIGPFEIQVVHIPVRWDTIDSGIDVDAGKVYEGIDVESDWDQSTLRVCGAGHNRDYLACDHILTFGGGIVFDSDDLIRTLLTLVRIATHGSTIRIEVEAAQLLRVTEPN